MKHPPCTLKIANASASTSLGPWEVGNATIGSLTAQSQGAAWGTAVLTPKWSNNRDGPWFTFMPGEMSDTTLGPGSDSIAWIVLTGKGWWDVFVTTVEGADETIEVCAYDNG